MRLLTIKEIQELQLNLMKELHIYLESKNINYYLIAGSALGALRHKGFIPWDDDIDIGMFRDEYEKFLTVCSDFNPKYDIVNYRNAKNCDFCLTRIYFNETLIDDESLKATKLDKRLYFDIFPIDNVPNDANECDKYEKRIKKIKGILACVDVRNYKNSQFVLLEKKVVSLFLRPFRNLILIRYEILAKKYKDSVTKNVCSIYSQYPFEKQVMPRVFYGTPTLHCFSDAEFYIPEQIENYLSTLYGENYMDIPSESKRRKGHAVYSLNEE